MLSRNITGVLNYILDNLFPPLLRDCRWLMYPILRIVYGKSAKAVMHFKDRLPFMTQEELNHYYELIQDAPINQRETDLNSSCMRYITQHLAGSSILDAACGRGALIRQIQAEHPDVHCTGADIVDSGHLPDGIVEADLLALPFVDGSFDTVLCTHALEHIPNHRQALRELLRVARQRVIVVVPRQREYKYTVDLHVHFLPYMYSFQRFVGIPGALYLELGRDFLCVIDKEGTSHEA